MVLTVDGYQRATNGRSQLADQRPVYPWGDDWKQSNLAGMRSVPRGGCIWLGYDAAGTRPDVRSAFGLEDTTGPGPEWVSAGADRFERRGCAGFSRQGEQANDCKLARVQESSRSSLSAFRCASAP